MPARGRFALGGGATGPLSCQVLASQVLTVVDHSRHKVAVLTKVRAKPGQHSGDSLRHHHGCDLTLCCCEKCCESIRAPSRDDSAPLHPWRSPDDGVNANAAALSHTIAGVNRRLMTTDAARVLLADAPNPRPTRGH